MLLPLLCIYKLIYVNCTVLNVSCINSLIFLSGFCAKKLFSPYKKANNRLILWTAFLPTSSGQVERIIRKIKKYKECACVVLYI